MVSRSFSATEFATDCLAVVRLTRLATKDDITAPLRLKVRRAAMRSDVEDPIAAKVDTLLSCPHCVSIWAAVGVVAARQLFPRIWEPVALVLAYSAVTGLLAENYG